MELNMNSDPYYFYLIIPSILLIAQMALILISSKIKDKILARLPRWLRNDNG